MNEKHIISLFEIDIYKALVLVSDGSCLMFNYDVYHDTFQDYRVFRHRMLGTWEFSESKNKLILTFNDIAILKFGSLYSSIYRRSHMPFGDIVLKKNCDGFICDSLVLHNIKLDYFSNPDLLERLRFIHSDILENIIREEQTFQNIYLSENRSIEADIDIIKRYIELFRQDAKALSNYIKFLPLFWLAITVVIPFFIGGLVCSIIMIIGFCSGVFIPWGKIEKYFLKCKMNDVMNDSFIVKNTKNRRSILITAFLQVQD